MMADAFFKQLDGKLAALKSAEAAAADRKASNRAFAAKALADLRPIADEYASRLNERGIKAKVSGNDYGLSFELRWSNGDDHSLSVASESDANRLKIVRHSTDHTTGKRYQSTDGTTYDASSWKASHFEVAVQGLIDDYVTLADKHGGLP
ncbi:hypothetical protein ACFOYU_17210 [Microvirga sp. GCM10011540]|uniref:hypothetical protein n=1 Tax=Microvirga sp. GCM10011540 TaxID=3317338 RepID=UPI00361429ED